MATEITIPTIGESITEGFLAEWLKADGDWVAAGDEVLVLETDKVTMNVTADGSGRLKRGVETGETVQVGQVVGTLEQGDKPAAAAAPTAVEAEAGAEGSAPEVDTSELAPAVRRLVVEHDLDPSAIEGTGRGGRLTKEDVLRHLAAPSAPEPAPHPAAEATPAPESPPPAATPQPAAPQPAPGERQTRTPMTRLRQRLAERLTEVQRTAAILTTFNEVDMSRVMALRARYKEVFTKRHEVGLGFMSFFVKAAVDALKTVPEVNAYIDGPDLVTNHYYDIGVAVSSDRGLVVPVVRDADRLSFAEVERKIAELAGKAQDRRLELSELTGAVFTVSNGGIFGSMLSTPILNPPGSAILGMHAIKKRAVVVDDEIVIRPMMFLALSYDHRVIDGREAVTFLKRVVDCLESPERMLLEV